MTMETEPDSPDSLSPLWKEWALARLLEKNNKIAQLESDIKLEKQVVKELKETVDAADRWMRDRYAGSFHTQSPGTEVKIIRPGIKGTVREVRLAENNTVTYIIGYWSNKSYYLIQCLGDEIEDISRLKHPLEEIEDDS